MMNKKLTRNFLITGGLVVSICTVALADKFHSGKTGSGPGTAATSQPQKKVAAGCSPGIAKTDLDVNNVRTTIMTGGDMWWDLDRQRYEIPKGSDLHSLFAGALWIGGIDAGGQLKVAAMNYRQGGSDFFPGPIDIATNSISAEECLKYDKHWKITRAEVQEFVDNFGNSGNPVPTSITTWPGNGNSAQTPFLAPFNDVNGDGVYDPAGSGDYPNYDLSGNASCSSCNNTSFKDLLFGDQTLWWVFNDVGNIHGETGAEPIGLEIQAQAFAFATNDEINNMTFYQYKIINRSTFTVNDTYFGQWVDCDMGNATDDYVGCDVERGLGYCYNGDAYDESTSGQNGYGFFPPAVGVDFFQGPLADPGDGIDNDKDQCLSGTGTGLDEECEEIIMSKFVYYNNSGGITGEPQTGTQFYNYLRGIWKDGSKMTYGGTGYQSGGPECNFMFPGSSDHIYEWGTGGNCKSPGAAQPDWDEKGAGNVPADRRFVQSAGKFTLNPGAVNYITTGVVWARASSGDNLTAINLMKQADDKAQKLFKNCFKVPNGPDAPDLAVRELDKEIILSWTNKSSSNNYNESYSEVDVSIPEQSIYTNISYTMDTTGGDTVYHQVVNIDTLNFDNKYHFQGYQLYQLKDATVSITDIKNTDKARLAFQCDIKDGVSRLINYTLDPALGADLPVEEVNGVNKGVTHSLSVKQDLFAAGNNALINHKTYYYTIISYSYNEFKKYKADEPINVSNPAAPALDGQKKTYFAGRRNIKSYSAIPHIPSPNNYGQILHAKYGDSPMIRREEGTGNGGSALEFTQASIDEALSSARRTRFPVYQKNAGPVKIKVYDPVSVPKGDFEFRLLASDVTSTAVGVATWSLTNKTTGVVVLSDRTIAVGNEQLIPQWGLSVYVEQVKAPGPIGDPDGLNGNGFIKDTTEIEDISKDWLSGIPDLDGFAEANWIRSGTSLAAVSAPHEDDDYYQSDKTPPGMDIAQVYEKVVVRTFGITPTFSITGGTWAPYRLCAYQRVDNMTAAISGPAWSNTNVMRMPPISNESENPNSAGNRMKDLMSVDVVFTPNKDLWTHCLVLEASDDNKLSQGKIPKLNIRAHASVNKEGNADDTQGSQTGMGWFPGYAINLETGERLNIMFAEDSWLSGENGADMIWNPTATLQTNLGDIRAGGKHYVYIMNSMYDECENYKGKFATGNTKDKETVFKDAKWVTIPVLSNSKYSVTPGTVFVPPTQVKIKIRVTKPYALYNTAKTTPENSYLPLYTFNTNDLYNEMGSMEAAKNALDLVNVVPNPYYAYSSYETKGIDNVVKITNLPSTCTISIYSLNGNLIKRINRSVGSDVSLGEVTEKSNLETSEDWNLTNDSRTPIASGIYLIHVRVDGVGERVIKWFGVMRPIDLNTY